MLGGVLAEAERIGSQSVKRLAKADEIGIPTRLVMMHFESAAAYSEVLKQIVRWLVQLMNLAQ